MSKSIKEIETMKTKINVESRNERQKKIRKVELLKKKKLVERSAVHNAYIEQLDSSVYNIELYTILSYLL